MQGRALRPVGVRASLWTWGVLLAAAAIAAEPKTVEPSPDDGLLTFNLIIRLPNGSPAQQAEVQSISQWLDHTHRTHTDNAGRATIRDVFGNGASIHARSVDGNFQATWSESAGNLRTILAKPVNLILAPAVDHQVKITADEKPVAGTQVVAYGQYFQAFGKTDPDGIAKLKLPANDPLTDVAAWHPKLGAAGISQLAEQPPQAETALVLHVPAPFTIRVVDPEDRPVANLDLVASSLVLQERPESRDWGVLIRTQEFAAAKVRTNEKGEATIPWAPRDHLAHFNVHVLGDWKVDETDHPTDARRDLTVHVRRMKRVTGRLIMPEGADPQGLLIEGYGFGLGNTGDVPQVRVRRDGTFTLNAASNHGYVLGVIDREWTCEPWTGAILKTDDAEPAPISLSASRAVPVTVRITGGPKHEPVVGAWVDLQQQKDFSWIDAAGKKQRAGGSIGSWLKTDAEGMARGGVRKGAATVRISSGKWHEERQIRIDADEPVEIEFHRAWEGRRKVVARMTHDEAAYRPSEKLTIRAWTGQKRNEVATIHRPKVLDDQTIEVEFEEQALSLLVIDHERQLSGFAKLGAEEDAMELQMQPSATYSGTLVDENEKPLAGRTLQLMTEKSLQDVTDPQQTDEAGKFRFMGVAINVPLRIFIKNDEGQTEYFVFEEALLEPGEVRDAERLEAYRTDGIAKAEPPPRPLTERLKRLFDNVRPCGMHALVALQGDDSEAMIRITEGVVEGVADDEDEEEELLPIYNYLPMTVAIKQLEAEAAFVKDQKWPHPQPGELVLIALDGRQQFLAAETITIDDADSVKQKAETFLTRYKPTFEDARDKLAKARTEAERDGRRLWVISSGPRCGPCFLLARWIERHHETLEKDYVIVKVNGLEANSTEVAEALGGAEHGIPWHVITEPNGKILITSESPLGNIGMPGGVEGARHFRKMLEQTARRLTREDIDGLIQSLSSEK